MAALPSPRCACRPGRPDRLWRLGAAWRPGPISRPRSRSPSRCRRPSPSWSRSTPAMAAGIPARWACAAPRRRSWSWRSPANCSSSCRPAAAIACMLTRASDSFVALRERVARAQAAKADLFLSIHADSHPDPDVRGASVYTLSEDASDREAAALAARENRADAVVSGVRLANQPDTVARTLVAMSQRGTVNNSRRLADTIVRTFGQQRRAPAAAHPSPGGLRRADLARYPRRPGRARLSLQSAGREAFDRAPAPTCPGAGAARLDRCPFCGRGCHKKGVTFCQSSALLPLGLAA